MDVPIYPNLQHGKLTVSVGYRNEIARFDTPYSVRSMRWARSMRSFSIAYDLLRPSWWQSILDLFERQKGGLSEFRFNDYTPAPLARQFGVGDGVTTVFHLPHDYTSGAVIYGDGAVIAAVYVDADTGRVEFDVAPARDVDLTYDATEAGWRVRFAEDAFKYERLNWGGYAGTVTLEQVADQQDVYPVRQVVCGGELVVGVLAEVGDAVAYSFVCPRDITVVNASWYMPAFDDPGTVRVSLCDNLNGAPSTVLAYGDDIPAGVGWQTMVLGTSAALTRGTRYWMVIAAQSGTWNDTHRCEVQYTLMVPDPIPGEDQDDILWGGYLVQDRQAQNTPNSWLGVIERGAWKSVGMGNVGAPTSISSKPPGYRDHDFRVGDQVVFRATVGVGVVAGTIYWVVTVIDEHHFVISATPGGAPMSVYDGVYEDPNWIRLSGSELAWSLRNVAGHPAFFLNTVPPIVGHCQEPLTQVVYGNRRTRENFPLTTTHDIAIDRVGAVFSTNGAPADSLHYAIIFDSDPATVLRTGILSSPIDTDTEPTYVEAILWSPLVLPTGEGISIDFYSASSIVGAPWMHWGHLDEEAGFTTGWDADWNHVRWAEDLSRAKVSIDAGATWPTSLKGAWTVRCRGTIVP